MIRIVREHYPVENLPDDLRPEVPGLDTVTVTIDAKLGQPTGKGRPGNASWPDLIRRLHALKASGEIKPVTPEEAVARIRALRDEWD